MSEYSNVHTRQSRTDRPELSVNVDIDIPRQIYDEAQSATENSDDGESIRDHLFDRIDMQHRFVVDGNPVDSPQD